MVESRAYYLCDIPHLLGGNGHQPLYTVLLHLPFLLDDLLHDVVYVHFALGRNLGASMAGGSRHVQRFLWLEMPSGEMGVR